MNIICPNSDQTLNQLLSTYVTQVDKKLFLDTRKLKTDGSEGVSNWELIQRLYSKDELDENSNKYSSAAYSDILVKKGTQLELRTFYIKRDIPSQTQRETFRSTGFKPFITQKLNSLFKDPKYTQELTSLDGAKLGDITSSDITVYVWCRALSLPNTTSQDGTWLNISPFIESITTQTTQNGGSFSFSIMPLSCEYSDSFGWRLSQVHGYDSGNVRDDVTSFVSLSKFDKDNQTNRRETFFFNTVLQENDLVFIRFEKLTIDQELDSGVRTVDGRINPSDIPYRNYDMIGLVDNVGISSNPNNVSTGVSGRDLMKILVEDGSYFFPEQFAQNIFTDENSLLTKRNRYELEAQSLSAAGYTFKTIETILKFIFNKFSNIGYVSNQALNGYGDRAVKDKYQLKSSELSRSTDSQVVDILNSTFLKEDRQGAWRIVDFVFDPQVKDRVLADNSISQDNGSIINSIKKICQEPFVEFWGDTFGDKYNFIIRKQPFDAQGYRGLVYDDVKVEEYVTQNKTKDIKVKQNVLSKNAQRNITKGRDTALSSLVIDIDDVDVIAEPNFVYHDEVYCWYRVIPRGLGVMDDTSSFLLAPIIPFDEYAEIWGNKTLSIEYNYAPSQYAQDSQSDAQNKYAETQTFYDLQYLIQCNQYLPFTRRGTIVLVGDRRIKRGMFIYFKPTKEVFYVDSVTQSRTLINKRNDRTTTLQVSRGMREEYIKGVKVRFPSGEKNVSYFDIAKTEISNEASINNNDFLKNWAVDRDIFNFFVQRRQWVD